MKKAKFILCTLFVLIFTVSLVLSGCASAPAAPSAAADVAAPAANAVGKVALVCSAAGANDNGYNQTAVTGLKQLADETGLDTKVVETTTDYPGTLKTLAENGFGLIFSLEYDFTALIEGVGGEKPLAEQFPETTFVVFNANPNVDEAGKSIHNNVVSIMFNVNESSFLAGALSVLVNENNETLFDTASYSFTQGDEGRKLGFMGGTQSSGIEVFSFGFMEGVQEVAKELGVNYTMYTTYDAGFVDTAQGASTAGTYYGEGANVVYTVAGSVGDGVDAKAKEIKKLSIQVDADKDSSQPGSILTSVLKNTNVPVYELGKEYAAGTVGKMGGTQIDYTLASGATGITNLNVIEGFLKTDDAAKTKWQEIKDKLAEITEKINVGELKVTNAQVGETLDMATLANIKQP